MRSHQRTSYLYQLIISLFGLFSLATFSGCVDDVAEGYKKFYFDKDISYYYFEYPGFSFEYPEFYGEPYYDPFSSSPNILFNILPSDSVSDSLLLHIEVLQRGKAYADTESYIESIKTTILKLDGEIVEQKTIIIMDVLGESITYTRPMLSDNETINTLTDKYISRRICFEYNDCIWGFFIQSSETRKLTTFSELEHILDSLDIND